MTYKIDSIRRKDKRDENPFISLKLGDRWIYFFKKVDFSLQLKKGDFVDCEITKRGDYWHGINLKKVTVSSTQVKTNIEELEVIKKLLSDSDIKNNLTPEELLNSISKIEDLYLLISNLRKELRSLMKSFLKNSGIQEMSLKDENDVFWNIYTKENIRNVLNKEKINQFIEKKGEKLEDFYDRQSSLYLYIKKTTKK